MDEFERRLRGRLHALAEAVPVGDPRRTASTTPRTAGIVPLLAGLAVVVALVAVISVLGRGPTPATSPVPHGESGAPLGTAPAASGAPTASSMAPAGGAWLRLVVRVEEACPPTEGGGCHYTSTLTGPDGAVRDAPLSGDPVPIALGDHRIVLQARVGDDVITDASPMSQAVDARCESAFSAGDQGATIVVLVVFRRGECVVAVDDGQVSSRPMVARPSPDAVLPYPEGCPAYGLSLRRCVYIVDDAIRDAGAEGQPARIELLGDSACSGKPAGCTDVLLGGARFLVRVRVTPSTGRPSDHPVFCGLGGNTTLRCTEQPRIRVHSPIRSGYDDVPCGREPGPGACASPVPTVDPRVAAQAVALRVPVVEIPIDRTGAYVVDIGDAILPNGKLTETSVTLADDTRVDVLVPDGIQLEVLGADGEPLANRYDHGWRAGTERVGVRIRFRVEAFDPGAAIILTDVVVR